MCKTLSGTILGFANFVFLVRHGWSPASVVDILGPRNRRSTVAVFGSVTPRGARVLGWCVFVWLQIIGLVIAGASGFGMQYGGDIATLVPIGAIRLALAVGACTTF